MPGGDDERFAVTPVGRSTDHTGARCGGARAHPGATVIGDLSHIQS